tara:strand:+ start:93 stop:335 length:243 start_codon:yes stop_codon:yes gene_type:complete
VKLSDRLLDINSVVAECTDECFFVNVENDCSGAHYAIYVVNETIHNLSFFRDKLDSIDLKKRYIIILSNQEKIMQMLDYV